MDKDFKVSVQRFNDFAEEYANRFMDIGAYQDSIDKFCETGCCTPKILELACGPGNITRYLREKFPDSPILAIDLAPAMINLAQGLLQDVAFRIMDVREIVSLHQKFDMIMASFCLPFLSARDAEKLISDCALLLNQGGRLYISTMEGDEIRAGYETTSFSGNEEIYFNYHRKQDLEKYLMDAGLSIIWFKCQVYEEGNGTILQDLIFIGENMGFKSPFIEERKKLMGEIQIKDSNK